MLTVTEQELEVIRVALYGHQERCVTAHHKSAAAILNNQIFEAMQMMP